MEFFCHMMPEWPIAGWEYWEEACGLVPTSKGVGGASCKLSEWAAQRFSCTFLRSLGSLFCYSIKGNQLQKSLNLSSRRPEITWAGGVINCSMGFNPF